MSTDYSQESDELIDGADGEEFLDALAGELVRAEDDDEFGPEDLQPLVRIRVEDVGLPRRRDGSPRSFIHVFRAERGSRLRRVMEEMGDAGRGLSGAERESAIRRATLESYLKVIDHVEGYKGAGEHRGMSLRDWVYGNTAKEGASKDERRRWADLLYQHADYALSGYFKSMRARSDVA